MDSDDASTVFVLPVYIYAAFRCLRKLHVEFSVVLSIGHAMDERELRRLFTEIGCIMEDASLIALVWGADDGLDIRSRYQKLLDAHTKIGKLLSRIDSPIEF